MQENRRAVPFDVKYNGETMDLLSPLGFSNALYHTLNLDLGAGATSAPVCSTFVFMCLHFAWVRFGIVPTKHANRFKAIHITVGFSNHLAKP